MVLLKQGLVKIGGRCCGHFCEYRHGSRSREPYMTLEIWEVQRQRIHLTIFHGVDQPSSECSIHIHIPMDIQDKTAQQLVSQVQEFIKDGCVPNSDADELRCAAK